MTETFPVQILIDELKNEETQHRLNAVRRLSTIAKVRADPHTHLVDFACRPAPTHISRHFNRFQLRKQKKTIFLRFSSDFFLFFSDLFSLSLSRRSVLNAHEANWFRI
jgi:hypothetical protein